jgi:chondroitin AC lyase
LSWYLFGSNTFAGGVSNSKNGLIAYEHSYNGIQARKAYFFIGDVLFCMGSGINAFLTQPVVTSVNQCLLNGAVYVGFDNQSQLFSDSSHIFTNLQWVYHDKVGYYFPQGGEISLQQLTQSGTWKSVDGEADDSLVSKKVFSLWINHGNTPKDESYCYAVVPGRTLEQFKLEVQNSGFIIERNDKEIQAISNKQKRCYAVIFYKPGVIRMTDGFQIRTDQPALVLIENQTDKYSISVADPTYSQARLTLSLNRKIAGPGVSYSGNTSVLEIAFPLGQMTGSTVTNLYLIEN